ncbi:ABC transporter permease [Streptomyces spiramyceticus]|uniref:ABC transporter permease n=1 Tax=Streptomyces spiramyceticus TaxID=299717 RepID=UPI00237A6D67|nr:ABC transporter permease [Streptomyces spiramyceticus]
MNTLSEAWDWLTSSVNWSGESGVWARLGEHLFLTVVCLLISCLIALPVALVLGHLGKGGALAVNISNVGRAVPTFAVLVLLLLTPIGEYGDWPTIIALVLFAVPPLLTNAYVGMRGVDRDIVRAARGISMTGGQLLWRVELPLALPLILTGVRIAAVQLVATATIAALVGGGADQGDQLALRHLEGQVVDGRGAVRVDLADLLEPDHVRHAGSGGAGRTRAATVRVTTHGPFRCLLSCAHDDRAGTAD